MTNPKKSLIISTAFAFLFAILFTTNLAAQRSSGAVGIGAQFGQPTGLTVKIYEPRGISTDILAAWDLDDFFFLNVHGLFERHLGNSGNFHYFVGPGGFIGIRDSKGGESGSSNDVALGISGTLGLNVMVGIAEIYGQITPRLELVKETKGDIGGGVGVRFYF